MRILDCTAGLRQIHHDKTAADTIFLDIRADKNTGGTGIFGDLYGHYTHEEIHQLTTEAARQIHRTLKATGVAIVKVATQNITLATWIKHLDPLHIRCGSQVKANRRGGTFWITCTKGKGG